MEVRVYVPGDGRRPYTVRKRLLILRYEFLVKMDLAPLPRQARDKHGYRSGTFGVGEEGVAGLQAATVCLHTPSSWRYELRPQKEHHVLLRSQLYHYHLIITSL
jgi:hypothetical protein